MEEKILNIYLIINYDMVEEFRAVAYIREGGDDNKIKFLKSRAKQDFETAYRFDAPADEKGKFMSYRRFHKFEKGECISSYLKKYLQSLRYRNVL